ncbi:MAG: hypothetical protein Q8920_09535 [Bacillota bacterium]|nr:hypothetical protein [Bacillota bacterium]
MLSKLLKYEIKATVRIFLPLYVVLLVIAAINKGISALSPNGVKVPEVISTIIYGMILVGIFVMTLVVMIQRFYKNLLSDEGYLSFTLPTKTWKHIVSKLLIAMMWTVASGIIAIASIIIVAYDKIFANGIQSALFDPIEKYFSDYGITGVIFILEALLAMVICLASSILLVYASIAIGHLFNRHRILLSLGAFMALSTVSQIIFAIAGIAFGKALQTDYFGINNNFSLDPTAHITMWCGIIFFGLLSAGYFAITNYILSRRLNLE